MSFEITPLTDAHAPEAAALWAASYRSLRLRVRDAPPCYEAPEAFVAPIARLAAGHGGVAAWDSGRLVGYLAGFPIEFRGRRAFFSPEWANAVDRAAGVRAVGELYSAASAGWLDAGCYSHVVAVLAHDRRLLDAWRWLGFGYCVADAVRDLTPLDGAAPEGVELRRGTPEDLDTVRRLVMALDEYLAAPPIFLLHDDVVDAKELRHELADPRRAYWLAYRRGRPIAYLRQGPASENACDIIVDEGTTSVSGAFTEPAERGSGVGSALLDRALAWGREQGYVRCAVDFETMNVPGARFWLRHFQPVALGLWRVIDDRARSRPAARPFSSPC